MPTTAQWTTAAAVIALLIVVKKFGPSVGVTL